MNVIGEGLKEEKGREMCCNYIIICKENVLRDRRKRKGERNKKR